MSERHVNVWLLVYLSSYLFDQCHMVFGGKKGFPFSINVVCIINKSSFDSKWWACLSVAFIMSRVCVCLQGHRSVWAPYCEMWQDAEPSLQKEPRVTGGAADPGGGGGRRCLHRPQDAGAGLLAQDQRRQRLDAAALLCGEGKGALRARVPRTRR